MNPMVTKNQKHMIDTQLKIEHKHTTKETKKISSHKEETKKKEEEMSRQLSTTGNILQKNSN